ncbi:hypothetical protein SAMN04487869_11149 [Marinobacter sp. DSM 26671]|jgi:hypothetical protein|uniref:hypothetical protein n=1 Tax=Marinobacter sp. DSM 26671 TaxID=1761793 RepID=UPI0008E94819|nr:hypothetical protein [Marinobacter sp. DSM 26671]MTI78580.1 hypothetical protein [Marinobacter sp.]SFE60324.1 hypothetical protein SAMN04487869_11149 [Marinobacter sp. DSM 26671]|tara:strand:+ start:363 stop:965 length:603 start_codon:yes stop_codon:yes gene_type:complete
MGPVKRILLSALFILLFATPAVQAQSETSEIIPNRNALSDGKLSEDEIKKYAALAAKHIQELTAVAREEVGNELEQSGVVIPAAWMMMNDGEVKRVRLGESGEQAAATMKVLMFRAALKSLARHGKILATAIVYAGTVEGEKDTRVLAIEHEHRLGLSGLQVVPYQFDQGALSLGKPSTEKKPYELFYEGREKEGQGEQG